MTYEYTWVDADELDRLGAVGWRVVPGIMGQDDEMLLMERSKPTDQRPPPPGSDPAIS